jgi:hypothetical protein
MVTVWCQWDVFFSMLTIYITTFPMMFVCYFLFLAALLGLCFTSSGGAHYWWWLLSMQSMPLILGVILSVD